MTDLPRDDSQRPYHHGNLRSALIEAGLALLEQGEQRLTIRAAANAVGVSHTAPYNHFPDKDALLAAIAVRGFEDLTADTDAAALAAGPDAGDRLVSAGLAYILFAAERPSLYRLMFGPRKMTGASDEVRTAGLDAFEVLVGIMEYGLERGDFRAVDPRAAAFSAWALVHGMAQMALDRTGPLTREDREGIAARLHAAHDIMMHGLRPHPT
jgi:AcrR family transcriptional regulator